MTAVRYMRMDLLVIAAKYVRPHVISVTCTSVLNSFCPNNVDGKRLGSIFSSNLGPLPRIPDPHTYTSPLSETHAKYKLVDGCILSYTPW